MTKPDIDISQPEPCGREGCDNECAIVDRGEPAESRVCLGCYILDSAKEILRKALVEVYDLGFDVMFTETEASGLPVTMETVELARVRVPCPHAGKFYYDIPGWEDGHGCPVCKSSSLSQIRHCHVTMAAHEEHAKATKSSQ